MIINAKQEHNVESIEAIFSDSVPATADEINGNVMNLCNKIFNEIYKCSRGMACLDFIHMFAGILTLNEFILFYINKPRPPYGEFGFMNISQRIRTNRVSKACLKTAGCKMGKCSEFNFAWA